MLHKVLDKQRILCYTIYKIKEREVIIMFNTIKSLMIVLVWTFFVGIFVWVGISWIDIVIHNLESDNYVYPIWNFFIFFI
jgi:hypothetical protein